MKPNINGSFPSTQAGWGTLQGVRRPFGASFYFEAAKVSAKEGNRAPASCSMEKLPGQQQGATLISRLRCQHCPAGTLGCTGSLASAELQENWDNWEMHIGLDVSCCLGMQRYVSMEEELPRAREEKQQPELGKQSELTDSTTGRECQMHTHTWTAGPKSLDAPRHSLLGIFPVGFYPNLQVSKNPHRNPVPFLDCIVEAIFPGTRSLQKRVTRVTRKLEPAQGIINCNTVRPQKHLLVLQNPGEQRMFFIPSSSN